MYYDPAATGERIQNLRKDREVTQEQLAIDLNISDRYMRNLEKGEKVPSVDLFVELRERFGSSLDYIVLGVSASQREQELQDQLEMLRKELKEMQRRILGYAGNSGRISLDQTLYCCKPERLVPVKMAKPELLVPNENFSFQVHYGHSKGSPLKGADKPETVPCTLKIEEAAFGTSRQ